VAAGPPRPLSYDDPGLKARDRPRVRAQAGPGIPAVVARGTTAPYHYLIYHVYMVATVNRVGDSPPVAREGEMTTRWERLAEHIRSEIRAGRLKPGDLLPSYRQLGEDHQVSYATVRTALTVLRTEGWIVGEIGVGVRVREDHPS